MKKQDKEKYLMIAAAVVAGVIAENMFQIYTKITGAFNAQ